MHHAVVIARPSNATAPVFWLNRRRRDPPHKQVHLYRGLNPIEAVRVGGGIIAASTLIEPSVTVGAGAEVGENCVISADVTIGDRSVMGSQCVVLGGVKVGDGAKVGSNSVIAVDIPDGATVAPNSWLMRNSNE